MPETTAVAQIKRRLNVLVVATVLLYLAVGAGVLLIWLSNNTTQDALCTLRGDLQGRVEQSQKYLRDHPNGAPGIPAKAIRDGIKNQQRTIEALSSLSC